MSNYREFDCASWWNLFILNLNARHRALLKPIRWPTIVSTTISRLVRCGYSGSCNFSSNDLSGQTKTWPRNEETRFGEGKWYENKVTRRWRKGVEKVPLRFSLSKKSKEKTRYYARYMTSSRGKKADNFSCCTTRVVDHALLISLLKLLIEQSEHTESNWNCINSAIDLRNYNFVWSWFEKI